MLINNTKKQIENRLSVLMGKRILQLRRAALMLGVDFGYDLKQENGHDFSIITVNENHFHGKEGVTEKRVIQTMPIYSLHIHSAWRLLKNGAVYLGHSDFFARGVGSFKKYPDDETADDVEFTRLSEDLNKVFKVDTMRVIMVEASETGDLKVHMENDYCLELFIDSSGDNESWRFFKTDDDFPHFVV